MGEEVEVAASVQGFNPVRIPTVGCYISLVGDLGVYGFYLFTPQGESCVVDVVVTANMI